MRSVPRSKVAAVQSSNEPGHVGNVGPAGASSQGSELATGTTAMGWGHILNSFAPRQKRSGSFTVSLHKFRATNVATFYTAILHRVERLDLLSHRDLLHRQLRVPLHHHWKVVRFHAAHATSLLLLLRRELVEDLFQ